LTLALLRIDPIWEPLRNDPQFQKLTKEEGRELSRFLHEMRG